MHDEVLGIIATALEVERVSLQDSMDTISSWDSLATLNVMVALERRYGDKVAAIDDLSVVRSVQDVVDILKRESIIT